MREALTFYKLLALTMPLDTRFKSEDCGPGGSVHQVSCWRRLGF